LEDRSASYLAQKAIEAFVDAREYKREIIRASYEAALTEKAFISDAAMTAWVESWDTDNELPPPEPDIFRE
jgi:predicted transcriptional regulator